MKYKPSFFAQGSAIIYLKSLEECSQCKIKGVLKNDIRLVKSEATARDYLEGERYIELGDQKLQVDHADGNKTNNCVWNLRLVTPGTNTISGIGKPCVVIDPETEDKEVYQSISLAEDAVGQGIRFYKKMSTTIHGKNNRGNIEWRDYSTLSTVEHNWDLGNLGRRDTNKTVSNVLEFTAKKLHYTNVHVPESEIPWNNNTITGLLTGKSYNETHTN